MREMSESEKQKRNKWVREERGFILGSGKGGKERIEEIYKKNKRLFCVEWNQKPESSFPESLIFLSYSMNKYTRKIIK